MNGGFQIARKYLLIISVLLLAGAAFVASRMIDLHADFQLWGRLPLLFLSLAWAGISLLLFARKRFELWLGSTFSGVLLAIGFPPLPLTFLIFVAFVPLWYVLDGKNFPKPKAREVFGASYNAFVWWNLLSTYWIANTAFVAGLAAIGFNALFMALVYWAFRGMKNYVRPKFHFLLLASCWIPFELLHHIWEMQWPWLSLGNALSRFPVIAQWYEYTGIFGGSLWILAANWLVWLVVRDGFRTRKSYIHLASLAVLIVFPLIFSLTLYFGKDLDREGPVKVAVVQPNFEPHYEKFEIPASQQLQRFLSLSSEVVDENTDYLVFPETSFDVLLNDWEQSAAVLALHDFLKDHPGLTLISGFDLRRILEEGEEHDRFTRVFERGDGSVVYWEAANTAAQIIYGRDPDLYYKSKLVPGPEIFPYRNLLPFFEGLVRKLGGSTSGLRTQLNREAFSRDGEWAVGPLICYESVFGSFVSGYVKQGANLLFIMTNDGWWDDTAGHKQHMYYASLRAIEQRKPIARSANTGISCFIDSKGRIYQKTDYGLEATIEREMYTNDIRTVYNRFGDYIARFFSLLLAGFLLYFVYRKLATFLR